MGHIDDDVLGIVSVGEGVLVEASPLSPSQLNGDPGAQEGLVVAYFGNLLVRK